MAMVSGLIMCIAFCQLLHCVVLPAASIAFYTENGGTLMSGQMRVMSLYAWRVTVGNGTSQGIHVDCKNDVNRDAAFQNHRSSVSTGSCTPTRAVAHNKVGGICRFL